MNGAVEQHLHTNGNAESDEDSGGEEGSNVAAWGNVAEEGWGEKVLSALNALRRSRQHYDILLVGGGAEVAAHRAVLAAASPRLLAALPNVPTHNVPDVDGDSLRAIVDYAYTGTLSIQSAAEARRLYVAAWRLRVEGARSQLATMLVRRATTHDCLAVRALPAIPTAIRSQLDAFIAEHLEEVLSTPDARSLPVVRLETLRESAALAEQTPEATATAALTYLNHHCSHLTLDEVSARPHLVWVDGGGSLRDADELPAAGRDAPELTRYRKDASARKLNAANTPPGSPAEDTLDLRGEWCVIGAMGKGSEGGARALVMAGGQLAVARIAWSPHASGAVRGASFPLPSTESGKAGREGGLLEARCAHGVATLQDTLIVCGGYDRSRVLRSAEVWDVGNQIWRAAGTMRGQRARFPGVALRGALYALGGSDGHTELDTVDKYTPPDRLTEGGGVWSAESRIPGGGVSHAGGAGDETRGHLYVVGGWAGGSCVRAVRRYTPGSKCWEDAAPLLAARWRLASAVWGGALWAVGGCDAWHPLATTERLHLDDPVAWTPGPSLSSARRSLGACTAWTRLVVAGGAEGGATLRLVEALAPGAEAWTSLAPLRRPRADLGLAEVGGTLYAVGGFDGKEFLCCVEMLTAVDGEWTALTPPAPRCALSPTHSHKERSKLMKRPRALKFSEKLMFIAMFSNTRSEDPECAGDQ